MRARARFGFEGATALISGGMAEPLGGIGAPCLELLNITQPREVRAAHDRYLAAGASVLRTNTANASPERLDRYRMHDEAFIVCYMAAEHARDAVTRAQDADGIARTILGVARVEPGSRSTGFLPLDRVEAATRTMASGLAGGGADAILLEAAQDPARLTAAVSGARRGMADAGRVLPIHLKLRYDPLFDVPSRARVTSDLVAAASQAAGMNLAGLSLAPINLVDGWRDTLCAMARVFGGPLFAESARNISDLADLISDPVIGPRLGMIGGGLTSDDTVLLRQLLDQAERPEPLPVRMAANDTGRDGHFRDTWSGQAG